MPVLVWVAILAAGAGAAPLPGMAADDQLTPKPSVPAATPPAPAVPPPIASHADPKAPVPTNPPEQIAPPAKLHEPPALHAGSGAAVPGAPSEPAR
jgi:hypothetical protein